MKNKLTHSAHGLACAVLFNTLFLVAPAIAADDTVAVLKVVHGTVSVERAVSRIPSSAIGTEASTVGVERGFARLPARVGMALQQNDILVTRADGSAGITFRDNSLLSLGPSSRLVIDRFAFDSTTHDGAFESTLKKGKMAVVSGKIAKQTPDAMKVRTPNTILGLRGTEFLVEVDARSE